ncbi:helix-turn-helix transcriptional regulator [Foetidibacter luteolus]|uniref:helix-turn-helix transcriptional regulator n=1 Tax=Foetidibacter luteolus TaxID=2608880 RepID=UPI00129B691D|nr:helix-turn-helix transcriptional regulator [Foetidibacter luteolus]
MTLLKEIRLKTGLTQQQMADLLQLSTSTICMIEKGQRTLATGKTLKLYQLEEKLKASAEIAADTNISASDRKQKRNRQLLRYVKKLSYQQAILTKKYKQLQEKHQKHAQQLQSSRQLAAQPTGGDELETLLFSLLQLQNKAAVKQADEIDLALLQLKIDVWAFKEKRLKEIVEKFGVGR